MLSIENLKEAEGKRYNINGTIVLITTVPEFKNNREIDFFIYFPEENICRELSFPVIHSDGGLFVNLGEEIVN